MLLCSAYNRCTTNALDDDDDIPSGKANSTTCVLPRHGMYRNVVYVVLRCRHGVAMCFSST